MTELSVTLCGQTTTIACAPEDEDRLLHLLALISERAEHARAIVGDQDRWRQMLFTAIFLADELDGSNAGDSSAIAPAHANAHDDSAVAERISAVTDRLSLALERLEKRLAGT